MTTPMAMDEDASVGLLTGMVPRDYVLGGVRAVLPDAIVDDARVVVRDGVIVEVGPSPAGSTADLDGRGLLCVPGLIDVHSDALERERAPRPGVFLPWDFAVVSLEGKMSAAGITTVFHGAGFQEKVSGGVTRTAETANDICDAVTARSLDSAALVGHRILYRLDARSPDGAAALAEALGRHPATAESLPLVSHQDHPPGQGQSPDRRYLERYHMGQDGLSAEQAAERGDKLIVDRDAQLPTLERNMAWLGELAQSGQIRLVGHDADSVPPVQAGGASRGAPA